MKKTNKIILIVVLVLAVLLIGAGIYWKKDISFLMEQKNLQALIKNKPELNDRLAVALQNEKIILSGKQESAKYVELGLQWKALGELSGANVFFEKSLAVYENGIKKFGRENILFYLNGGKLLEKLGNYTKAETYYKNAIEIGINYTDGYLALAELYELKMDKSAEEVIAVYDLGLKQIGQDGQLILEKASYLRKVGKNAEALPLYQELLKRYPTNQGYKDVISKLEEAIKNK